MLIRPATLTDVLFLCEVGRSEPEFAVGTGGAFWSKEQLERWVESETDCTLIAAAKERIAGFLLAQYHPPTGKGVIENLYVDARYRNQGVGKALLARCEQDLAKLGCTYLSAMVRTNNSASLWTHYNSGFSTGHLFRWMGKTL